MEDAELRLNKSPCALFLDMIELQLEDALEEEEDCFVGTSGT